MRPIGLWGMSRCDDVSSDVRRVPTGRLLAELSRVLWRAVCQPSGVSIFPNLLLFCARLAHKDGRRFARYRLFRENLKRNEFSLSANISFLNFWNKHLKNLLDA